MKIALFLLGLMAFAFEAEASSTGVAVRMSDKNLYEEIEVVLEDIDKSLEKLLESVDPATTIIPTSSDGSTTEGSDDSTTESSEGTTTESSEGTTTESSEGTTTESSEGTTTESSEGTTTEGSEGTTTEGNEGTTTEGSEGTTTEGNEGTTTESNEGTTTKGSEGTTTEGNEGTTTEGSEGTTTEGSDGTNTENPDEKPSAASDKKPASNERHIHLRLKRNLLSIPVLAGLRKDKEYCNIVDESDTVVSDTCNKLKKAMNDIEKNTEVVDLREATETTLNELKKSNTEVKEVQTTVHDNETKFENVLIRESIENVKKEVSGATSSANDQVDKEKGDEALVISLSVIFSIIGVGIIGGGVYYCMKKKRQ